MIDHRKRYHMYEESKAEVANDHFLPDSLQQPWHDQERGIDSQSNAMV